MRQKYCLITNDDGWDSPGLAVLRESVEPFVPLVVAPEGERSAISHAINLSSPVRVRKREIKGVIHYICTGTPVDCIKLGVKVLSKNRPSLVLSGINIGPNLGMDLLYSGTVSAAMEGAILGLPAVALSLAGYDHLFWNTASQVVRLIISLCLSSKWPADTLLNVNIPNVALTELRGYRVTYQSESRFQESYELRHDPRGRPYYWLKGRFKGKKTEPGSDVEAVLTNFVSICPLRLNLTHYQFLKTLKKKLATLI
ncbi:MAG: 5'/3'-nucleotidase SurE [Candidatus Omnitrophica bacterium]|nr:5'/3'-nucleotidase SurE [Candidatus Omnitrophota bacterium]MCM8769533.1 5'/3'-nucleotidase SurE [Candidatus Omnitrophota bacterium]